MSKPRFEVLKIIAASSKPPGAYEILDALAQVIIKTKPPTAYRAINFWQKNYFIHKIESLCAYVVCQAGHRHAGTQLMICRRCHKVTETHLCALPEELIRPYSRKLLSTLTLERGDSWVWLQMLSLPS